MLQKLAQVLSNLQSRRSSQEISLKVSLSNFVCLIMETSPPIIGNLVDSKPFEVRGFEI